MSEPLYYPERGVVRGRIPGPLAGGNQSRGGTLINSCQIGKPTGLQQGVPIPAQFTRLEEPDPVFEHYHAKQVVLTHYSWSIFYTDFEYNEIRQGFVANCPLPALIAAMVHTKRFSESIKINEIMQPCQSIFRGSDKDPAKRDAIYNPSNHGKNKDICNIRFFRVEFLDNFERAKTDTSDFLWSSLTGDIAYAQSSKKALWVSIVEKAFVQLFCGARGYETLSDANSAPTANKVVKTVTGSVQVTPVSSSSNDEEIKTLLRRAAKVPTIARKKGPSSNEAHTLTVLNFDGQVHLFNALSGRNETKPLKAFKEDCDFILSPEH